MGICQYIVVQLIDLLGKAGITVILSEVFLNKPKLLTTFLVA